MIRATIGLAFLALLLAGCSGEKETSTVNSRRDIEPKSPLLLDDAAHQQDGDIFENTFVASHGCGGLRLVRWTTHENKHRLALAEVQKKGHWIIVFACGEDECHASVQYDNGTDDKKPDDNKVDFAANTTPERVVQEVCSIIKRRGGGE